MELPKIEENAKYLKENRTDSKNHKRCGFHPPHLILKILTFDMGVQFIFKLTCAKEEDYFLSLFLLSRSEMIWYSVQNCPPGTI